MRTYREVYLGSQRIALAVVSLLAMARGDGGREVSFEGEVEVEGGVSFEGAVLTCLFVLLGCGTVSRSGRGG